MDWKLKFISQENFVKHVKATIDKYGEKLESFDIKRFNKNIIDPIKLIFDKTVYQSIVYVNMKRKNFHQLECLMKY